MTKETNIKNYRKYAKADKYVLGFVYNHSVYYSIIDRIPPRFLIMQQASKKNGHGWKLQLHLKKAHKEQLLHNGAVCLGSEDLLQDNKYNKGVIFEKVVSEKIFGIEYRGKDSVGFWQQGDISFGGHEYEVKFNGGQIVAEKTLERLKKGIIF